MWLNIKNKNRFASKITPKVGNTAVQTDLKTSPANTTEEEN